jgi:hypothetical protein
MADPSAEQKAEELAVRREAEALRLADQREGDLAAGRARDLALAREQGAKDAEDEAAKRQTREHFLDINGSIAKTAVALDALAAEVHEIKEEQVRRDRVNTALIGAAAGQGAKKLTRLQVIGGTVMALIALASLAVAIAQSLGHA